MRESALVHPPGGFGGRAWEAYRLSTLENQLYLERAERVLRARNYSKSTAKAYLFWIGRFLRQFSRTSLAELGEPEVNEFLTQLAVKENVAASTQNQADAPCCFSSKTAG